MTEGQFQAQVLQFLRKQDVWFHKVWGGGFTKAGIPDILCCVNGLFIAVELKTEIGKASELQKYNLERIRANGGQAMVLRPDGFEDFKKMIKEVKKCPRPNIPIPE